MKLLRLILLLVFCSNCFGEVTDIEYARTPVIFHNDNYDHCMLRGDEALYCSFTYELEPLDPSSVSQIWKSIKELNGSDFNYRHDWLRHGICVPETCPNINVTGNLTKEINRCYDEIFKNKHLKGVITDLVCDTDKPRYPVDWIDICVGVIFMAYVACVIYASLYESSMAEKSEQEYQQFLLTTKGLLYSAFSVPKNWKRLSGKKSAQTEQLRAFQGVRFHNLLIVILVHTIIATLMAPVANTKYSETMHEKFLTLFFSSGSLAIGTNFFLSTFLLTYNLYSQLEGKYLKFRTVLLIFACRLMRLLPSLVAVLLFTISWYRHLGIGPLWNFYFGKEFQMCRRNGWTNVLFLNTLINSENMCIPHTWYLARDTQYFLIALLLLWIFKKYPKLMWPTLTGLLISCMSAVYVQNYAWDFPIVLYSKPEMVYELKFLRGNPQWHFQMTNFYGNSISSILGIALGYAYYQKKDLAFIEKHKSVITKYFYAFTYGPALSTVLLPSYFLLHLRVEHSAFWSSLFNSTARLIFSVSVSSTILLVSRGVKGITKTVLEWTPTYVLSQLSYTAYLIHFHIVILRSGTMRFPAYVSDYYLISMGMSDLILTYIAALVLSLLFELPISDLQKSMLREKNKPQVKDVLLSTKMTHEVSASDIKKVN